MDSDIVDVTLVETACAPGGIDFAGSTDVELDTTSFRVQREFTHSSEATEASATQKVLFRRGPGRSLRWLLMPAALIACLASTAFAQGTNANAPQTIDNMLGGNVMGGPEAWTSPEGVSSALQVMLLLTVLSIAPALLLMTTSFVRIIVVLGLLRQALGTGQLPPSQVLTAMTLFMTFLIMMPVWDRVRTEAITPYVNHEISLEEAEARGMRPIREFMEAQIERTGNIDDLFLFLEYVPRPKDFPVPAQYESLEDVPLDEIYTDYRDIPLRALLPAFMLSELKTAFMIGFQIYLPFLILDMVVSSVMISMGMFMLPPVLISLPFKLLLFVLVDGWRLVVGMLLESFQPFT
jgi:flagellar biosynthetic protein FliP